MNRPDYWQPAIFSDRVTVNGTVRTLSLLSDGRLWWPEGGQRSLTVEKEVIGFVADGPNIKLKTVVESRDGCCAGGSRGILVRNDVVFRPLSEESHRLWCQKLRQFVNSLGCERTASKGGLGHCNKDAPWSCSCRILFQGTGNGMAKSLLDSVGDPCAVVNAVLAIIRGQKRSVDVATIRQGETRFFSILMLAWGLVADIDMESEKYRWMGSARVDFYALTRIFHLRHYMGCVYFVPAPGFEAHGNPTSYPGNSTSKGSNSYPIDMEPGKLQRLGCQGPAINLENLSWRVLNRPFISVWLHNVPWGAENTKAAPDAKFSDGYLDLIIVKNCSKLSLLSLMSELDNGGHVNSPYVMYLKVKAFILEPGPRLGDQEKEGVIDVDGDW